MDQLPTVTDVLELKSGEYACTVNGTKDRSGFGPKSNGPDGRVYEAIMVEVAKGNYTPYVPYVPTYSELREREYPKVGDQLDAIWKQLDTLGLIPEAQAELDKIKAVKEKYTKPEQL